MCVYQRRSIRLAYIVCSWQFSNDLLCARETKNPVSTQSIHVLSYSNLVLKAWRVLGEPLAFRPQSAVWMSAMNLRSSRRQRQARKAFLLDLLLCGQLQEDVSHSEGEPCPSGIIPGNIPLQTHPEEHLLVYSKNNQVNNKD